MGPPPKVNSVWRLWPKAQKRRRDQWNYMDKDRADGLTTCNYAALRLNLQSIRLLCSLMLHVMSPVSFYSILCRWFTSSCSIGEEAFFPFSFWSWAQKPQQSFFSSCYFIFSMNNFEMLFSSFRKILIKIDITIEKPNIKMKFFFFFFFY